VDSVEYLMTCAVDRLLTYTKLYVRDIVLSLTCESVMICQAAKRIL